MKKPTMWGLIAFLLLGIGEVCYMHFATPKPSNLTIKTAKVDTKKKRTKPPLPDTHQHQPHDLNNNKGENAKSSSLSSKFSSNKRYSGARSSSSASSLDTGNAGKHGEGKMGNHKVNGKTVQPSTLYQIGKRLNDIGYDANSWSPQDMIDLYRYAHQQGTTSPREITKTEVEHYLKQ